MTTIQQCSFWGDAFLLLQDERGFVARQIREVGTDAEEVEDLIYQTKDEALESYADAIRSHVACWAETHAAEVADKLLAGEFVATSHDASPDAS